MDDDGSPRIKPAGKPPRTVFWAEDAMDDQHRPDTPAAPADGEALPELSPSDASGQEAGAQEASTPDAERVRGGTYSFKQAWPKKYSG